MTMHMHTDTYTDTETDTDTDTNTHTHMCNCLLAACTHMHIHIHKHHTHVTTTCLHQGFFPFRFSARVRCLHPCNPTCALRMHCACTVNLGGLCQAPKAQMPSDDLHQMVAALMVEMLTNDLTGIGLQTEGLTGV